MKTPAALNRRLGQTEHIYWLLDQLYCLNFLVFAELEGEFEVDDLQGALDVVQQENPVLRTRIVSDRSGQPCFKPVSASERRLTAEIHPLRNWRRQIEAQLQTPFRQDQEPLARFLWFRGKSARSVVAMVFHHSIADGRSGACVFLDVLRRAAGQDEPPHFKPAHPSSQQLDLMRDKGAVAGKLKELRFWLGKGRDILKFAEQLPGYDMDPKDTRKIKTLPFSIPARANTALLRACRERETTMHGALGAALLLALNEEFEQPEARFLGLNSLADLRGVLKGELTEQDLGLYIATLTTVHSLDAEPDFWHLAQEIPDHLRAVMNSGEANLIHSIYPEISLFTPDQRGARKLQKVVGLAPPSSMLTNIGRIEEPNLGGGLRLRSLAFAVSPPTQHPFCVTAASFGGRMYLNVLYDQCKLEPDQAQRITDGIKRRLEGEAGG